MNESKGQEYEDWPSSTHFPHIPRTLGQRSQAPLKWSFSHLPHFTTPGTLVPLCLLFLFPHLPPQWHAHCAFLAYLRARKTMSPRIEVPKAFTPVWPQTQPGDDDREDKMIFYSQQSFLGDSVSCSSTVYTGLTESQRDREENQLETNVSHQQSITELVKVCQVKPEE